MQRKKINFYVDPDTYHAVKLQAQGVPISKIYRVLTDKYIKGLVTVSPEEITASEERQKDLSQGQQ